MTTSTESITPLRRLLGRVRRAARGWICAEALGQLAVAAAGLFSGLLLLDWLIEPPPWARALAVAAACGCLAWLLVSRLVARLAVPLSDRSLALAIERSDPRCGDTLSTSLTLAAQMGEPVDASLAARTAAAAAELAAEIRPQTLFRRRRLLATTIAGIIAAGTVGWLAAARPAIADIWLRRLVLLEDLPWPRRVQLTAVDFPAGVRTVARGSDVDVVVEVTAAGPLPELVELRRRTAAGWEAVRMGRRGGDEPGRRTFGHLLEAVGEDLDLEVRGGDARLRGLRIKVVEPPTIVAVAIRYTLPNYLGGGRRDAVASRVVPIPRGSRVELDLEAGKPLAAARVAIRFAGPATAAAGEGQGDDSEILLAEVGPGEPPVTRLAATIDSLDADAAVTAMLTDTEGIAGRDPFTLLLAAVPDEPPRVAMTLAGISTAVTPQARLPFSGTLSDDHGLAEAAVSLTKGDDRQEIPIPRVRPGQTLVEIPAGEPEVVPLAAVQPTVGERISLAVTARDGCRLAGGPNLGTSQTWLLEVVSPESLQAMLEAREILLRRRFETAIEDLAQAGSGLPAAEQDPASAVDRLGRAADRSRGETADIAAAFASIRDEFANNGLASPELDVRLVAEIAEPLSAVAACPLTGLAASCRRAAAASGRSDEPTAARIDLTAIGSEADVAVAAMRAILTRMLELESFNEVVEKLRGVIDAQEAIRRDTLQRQRRRARDLLE